MSNDTTYGGLKLSRTRASQIMQQVVGDSRALLARPTLSQGVTTIGH